MRPVGRDEHVDDAERAGAHRPHVGDVGDHRGAAGAERVGGRNGGEIASPQMTRNPSPCGISAPSSPSMPASRRWTTSRSRLPSRPGAVRTSATSASRSAIAAIQPARSEHDPASRRPDARRGREPRAATFADALRDQGAPVVEVDWRPPAGGDAAMLDVLTRLWGRHGDAVAAANAAAVAAIEGCAPRAVTVAPAGAVVPGLRDGHAAALRPADRVGARLRPAAAGAARRGACSRAGRPSREAAAALLRARRDRARPGQRARPRRADDRRLLALDAGLGRRGRRRGARSRP